MKFFFVNRNIQQRKQNMKAISTQIDNLVDLLKKNISNKEFLNSRDNFDLLYEKVSQDAFKSISVLIENFIDDFTLKLSYSQLLKQLKTFLSLKPAQNDDQDEQYYTKQFDQVQQFMNNRKPVMQEFDIGQRGDIYKFLYQAQNKSKDIEEFMGNVDKLKMGKKFQMTHHNKWKKTVKHLPTITEDIQTQTQLNLQYLNTLQKKLPDLFMININQHISSPNQNNNNKQALLDIESRIEEIINERIQKRITQQKQQAQQQKQKQKQSSQLQKQQQKKKQSIINNNNTNNNNNSNNNKKKKPQQMNRRNSQLNMKRNSSLNNTASLKAKLSQFNNNNNKKSLVTNQTTSIINIKSESTQKLINNNINQSIERQSLLEENRQQLNPIQQQSINNNSLIALNNQQNNITINSQCNNNQVRQQQKLIPTFQSFLNSISQSKELLNLDPKQIRMMYDIMRRQISNKMNTTNNNTSLLINKNDTATNNNHIYTATNSSNLNTPSKNNLTNSSQQQQNKLSIQSKQQRKRSTSQKQVNTQSSYLNQLSLLNQLNNNNKDNISRSKFFSKNSSISNNSIPKSNRQLQQNLNSKLTSNTTSIYQNKNANNLQSQFNSTQSKNLSFKQQSNLNNLGQIKNSLPQLHKSNDLQKINRLQKCDSADMLAKQGQSADQYLKKLKDPKLINSPQNNKFFNKENYSLDMYKSKDFMTKNRQSQIVNLPSLNRRAIKPNVSLHEQIDESRKSPYMKKISKKSTIHYSSVDHLTLINKDEQCDNEQTMKRIITNKSKQDFRDEDRIMSQLTKISNEGSIKMNMKNIAMYINCVQSIHLRRCGEKCIHLERFYGFLQRNNIPNRRQLLMHKADMNSNVNI